MRNLSSQECLQLQHELSGSIPLTDALAKCIGETQTGGGIWRFFSTRYPNGGVSAWNSTRTWKQAWELAPRYFHAFGEDLFGNQLVLRADCENVFLWNHEDGRLIDLLLNPATLLETVVQSGLDWVDFYTDGSLKIGEARLVDIPNDVICTGRPR